MRTRRNVHRIRTSFILALLLLVQVAILAVPAHAEGTATIKGRVLDAGGKPLAGINVYFYQESDTGGWTGLGNYGQTDESGNYSLTVDIMFTGKPMTAVFGRYNAAWRARFLGGWQLVDYYEDAPGLELQAATHGERFTVSDGETKDLGDIQLNRYNATISGKVTDKAGRPIQDVRVFTYQRKKDGSVYAPFNPVITGPNGQYTVDMLPVQEAGAEDSVLYFEPISWSAWQAEFFNNIPSQQVLQGSVSYTLGQQARQPGVTAYVLNSGQTATANVVLEPTIKEALSVTSVSPAVPRPAKSFTVSAKLTPGHYYQPAVKVQLYKQNSRKQWIKVGSVKTMPLLKRSAGDTTYRLSLKLSAKGTYSVIASVGRHWEHSPSTSKRRQFVVR